MNEDTIKLLAIGAGGILIGLVFFGRKSGVGGSDVEATLESMRISSATNIAYAQAGIESTRIQADLSAQRDRNRSSIAIAGIENNTARYAVQRRADNELFGIKTQRLMFERSLEHELRSDARFFQQRRLELGHELRLDSQRGKRELLLDEQRGARERSIEQIRASAQRYASERGVALEMGRQSLEAAFLENQFVNGLVQTIPNLVDSFGRGVGYVRDAFGHGRPYRDDELVYDTIARRSPYPAGSGGAQPYGGAQTYGYPDFNDPAPTAQSIGSNVATGAVTGAAIGGPYGAAVGAAGGAGASFS